MSTPTPAPYHLRDLRDALGVGWQVFRAQPGPSLVLGVLLALIGTALWLALAYLGATPLGWVLTGGFLLIGPALLAGFFGLYRRHELGVSPSIGDAFLGFTEAGGGFWAVAAFCAFQFLVWLTDAGVLYAFQVGASPLMEGASGPWDLARLSPGARTFVPWSSPVGAFLAVGLYLGTAFSVPLLYERRTGLIPAVVASVRAVLRQSPCPRLRLGADHRPWGPTGDLDPAAAAAEPPDPGLRELRPLPDRVSTGDRANAIGRCRARTEIDGRSGFSPSAATEAG